MRSQGKDFIPSIVQKLSEKGDLSPIRLPRHQAPTEKIVREYMVDSGKWIHNIPKVIPSWRAKALTKLENNYYNIAFPYARSSGVHTKGSSLPRLKDLKKVRRMVDPYHIPDIGGKDGVLTKLIRSIPVGYGTCYKNATLIASAIPGVKVVFGLYPRIRGGVVRKTTKGLSPLEQIAIERMKEEHESNIDFVILHSKNLGNGWYYGPIGFKGNEPTLDLLDRDRLNAWTLHAWCSYKGYHFDPYLYNLNKRYGTKNRFYSSKNKKFMSWVEYLMFKETDIFQLTGSEMKTGTGKNTITEEVRKDLFSVTMIATMSQCFNLIHEHIEKVVLNRHNLGDWAFPVKIPSKRKWIKEKKLYPPGFFSK